MSRTQSTSPWIVTLTIYIIGVADDQEARGSTIEDLKLRRERGEARVYAYGPVTGLVSRYPLLTVRNHLTSRPCS
jgi:hypothetical protein